MKQRSKAEMAEYQRNRRNRLKERNKNARGLAESDEVCNTRPVTPPNVTPKYDSDVTPLPANYGQPDCQCKMCQYNRTKPEQQRHTINHGQHKTITELEPNEINRVSLPSDVDYKGRAYE